MCTQIWAKKSEKVNHNNNTLKEEEKKKVREIRRVLSLSLSLSFSASVTRNARDCSLVSLFCSSLLFALFSSERREERIKRAFKVKDKKIYCGAHDVVHSQRCPFVHQKSLKRRKATFCSEKIFPEILRGQCSPRYIRLRVQKNPFDSHPPHKESASTEIHRQTDRSLLEISDRKDPFLSAKRVNCNRSTS